MDETHTNQNGYLENNQKNINLRADIDLVAWRRFRARYALSEPFAWLEAQRRLFERLAMINIAPRQILDAAPRAGTGALALAAQYPLGLVAAHCASQYATLMLRGKYKGPFYQRIWNALRGTPASRVVWSPVVPSVEYDLIVCNLALTWVADAPEQLAFWARQLAPGGVLLFSALGPDTGRELRRAATDAGWTKPIAPDFVDMHDYGDMMVQAGLTTPVMDVERLRLTYKSADALRQDLSGLQGNIHPKRLPSLAGRGRFERLRAALDVHTPIVFELELVFGHAWKPLATAEKPASPLAASTVSLEQLKSTLPSVKQNTKSV